MFHLVDVRDEGELGVHDADDGGDPKRDVRDAVDERSRGRALAVGLEGVGVGIGAVEVRRAAAVVDVEGERGDSRREMAT